MVIGIPRDTAARNDKKNAARWRVASLFLAYISIISIGNG